MEAGGGTSDGVEDGIGEGVEDGEGEGIGPGVNVGVDDPQAASASIKRIPRARVNTCLLYIFIV
jgi:hypothetical protein